MMGRITNFSFTLGTPRPSRHLSSTAKIRATISGAKIVARCTSPRISTPDAPRPPTFTPPISNSQHLEDQVPVYRCVECNERFVTDHDLQKHKFRRHLSCEAPVTANCVIERSRKYHPC